MNTDQYTTYEVWKQVPGYEGRYDVSDQGRVRSWLRTGNRDVTETPRLIQAGLSVGYPRVNLVRYTAGGRRVVKSMHVHRLVLLAFVGPPPRGHEACHENEIRTDNRLANLRWDTAFGNKRDSIRRGNYTHGATHPTAKLTEDAVREIRQRANTGAMRKALAEEFGVSQGNISAIVNRRTWKHVS